MKFEKTLGERTPESNINLKEISYNEEDGIILFLKSVK
jgi:hypothetical protein